MGKALATLVILVVSALAYCGIRFQAARRELRALQKAGLPMPEYHPIFGHLVVLKKASAALPSNTIMHNVVWKIARESFPGGIFYLDLWPFARTFLIVADVYAASQLENMDLGKGNDMVKPIEVITGGPSLLTMDGPEWKRWRRLFSMGFSAGYLVGLAPAIADEVAVFRDLLLQKCRETPDGHSTVFQMEELTTRMAFDVIGRVVLDTSLNYQKGENELATALRSSIEWTSWRAQLNPVARYLTIRPIVQWLNNRTMNRYISKEIDRRFFEHQHVEAGNTIKTQAPTNASSSGSKSIFSLLIEDLKREAGSIGVEGIKQDVKTAMASQLRIFLFAGHDTTSAALTYTYYLLSMHPDALSRLMAEHDAVFGTEPAQALAEIKKDPHTINRLPFTTAVLKETLRLFPPASSMRVGRRGAYITDEKGRRFPTENCNVWTLNLAIHHDARYWVEPEKFLPERWLASPGDHLYPGNNSGAWRPFEYGPRSCIAQALSLLELKIALVLTTREVHVTPAYAQWDAMHPKKARKGAELIKTVDGNRAYQEEKGAAHPADGFPVMVNLRRP